MEARNLPRVKSQSCRRCLVVPDNRRFLVGRVQLALSAGHFSERRFFFDLSKFPQWLFSARKSRDARVDQTLFFSQVLNSCAAWVRNWIPLRYVSAQYSYPAAALG